MRKYTSIEKGLAFTMAGIQFTISRNRLEKSFHDGIELVGENGIKCSENTDMHYMILPLLDSGVADCPWGRMCFDMNLPEDAMFYLYLCAMNEPCGGELMMDPEKGFEEKIRFLAANKCLRFINKKDVLLYEVEGRYLWIAIEIIGQGVDISKMVVQAPGDNFINLFPEVYREKNSFMHRYLSSFSSIYNDFQENIDHMEDLLEPDKMPVQLLEMYLKWFGVDVSGGYISESVMRMLLKNIAWLMANKGTRQCIDRICEFFIGESPIILERSMMSRYLKHTETNLYDNLYGESPYDVTLLIESSVDLVTRRQLLHLLEQFKPVRCRIAVVFLENAGVLDSYNYLDRNACVYTNSIADLDKEQIMDGTVVIQ